MTQQFISGVFKLHNPSVRRREILDHVFEQYTLEADNLLAWSKANLETIRLNGKYKYIDKSTGEVKAEKYTEKSIVQVLPRASELEADIASCLREALVKNVATMLASYLSLEKKGDEQQDEDKQDVGFPVCRNPSPQDWPNALEELCSVGLDLEAEREAVANLLRVNWGKVMPVYYSRSRDFALLTDMEHKRFFVLLKLLPQTSSLAETITIKDGNLITISDCNRFNAGDIFSYRGKSGLLFPIELGRRGADWHWQYKRFLEPALNGDAFVKAAKLVKDDNDYYLHVSFGFEAPEVYEPQAYLGISRGMLFTTAYGLVNGDGAIMETGHKEDPFREIRVRAGKRVQRKQKRGAQITRKDYKQRELDGILHRLVNDILDLAEQHQAMVVFEDINTKISGRFYKSAYGKMYNFIEYKAAWRGVPVYTRRDNTGKRKPGVWTAYSSQICIRCGGDVERDEQKVICKECGAPEHLDAAAGVNLARRVMYRAKDWGGGDGKPGDYRAFHRSFANVADLRTKDNLREEVVADG